MRQFHHPRIYPLPVFPSRRCQPEAHHLPRESGHANLRPQEPERF